MFVTKKYIRFAKKTIFVVRIYPYDSVTTRKKGG